PAAHDGGYEAAAASRRMLLAPGEGERNRTGEGRKWRVGRGAGRPVTSESSSGTTWSGWSARSAWACTTSRSATAATAAARRTPTSTRSVWSSTGAARPADPSASRARSVRRAGGGAEDRALAPAPAPARVAYPQAPGTTRTAGDARSAALPVQQITLPELAEFSERPGPRRRDLLDARVSHHLLAQPGRPRQPVEVALHPLEPVRVQPSDLDQRRDRGDRRVVRCAVRRHEPHALHELAAVAPVARVLRRERHRLEADAGEAVVVQPLRQRLVVQPGGADLLERRIGAAPHGEVGALEEARAGVVRRALEVRHVRRRRRPRQPGLVEPLRPPPPLHAHDLQVRADAELLVHEPRQLAGR